MEFVRAKRLRVYTCEQHRHGGMPVYEWLVQTARAERMAGATVLRGLEGYGVHSHLHTAKVLRMAVDLPVIVEIVDMPDRISAYLDRVGGALSEGLLTLEDVEMGHAVGPERKDGVTPPRRPE